MKNLSREQWMGIIRAALTTLGGVLIGMGKIAELDWGTISGAVMSSVGAVWSILAKQPVTTEEPLNS